MAKKKDWTLPFFRGQYMDECIGVIVDKLHSMGYYDNYDENKKEVEKKTADYTFEACLMFKQISKTSASGLQFIFEDVDFGDVYPMLAGEFSNNVKYMKDGCLKGVFGFEKKGSRKGIVLKELAVEPPAIQ